MKISSLLWIVLCLTALPVTGCASQDVPTGVLAWVSDATDSAKCFLSHSEPAVFLNPKGKQLSARAIDLVIRRIGTDESCSPWKRPGVVAEIPGHKRLETTQRYSLPSVEDREHTLEICK